jgi:hypothetical protein
MRFPKLDQDTLQICVYCDASLANNEEMSSQMCYIVFLTDGKCRCALMAYNSVTCKRVTRSVLAAEAISFVEGFDQGYTLKTDLQELLGRNILLTILTDSKTTLMSSQKHRIHARSGSCSISRAFAKDNAVSTSTTSD